MAERVVTVFGGTGFLGHAIVRRLAASGARVRVASRSPGSPSIPPGEGAVEPCRADIRNPDDVARAVAGATGVVNAVSLYAEKRGVTEHSPSPYVRSRARGEARVRDAFPAATILRPSVIFGPGDAFISTLKSVTMAPVVPLFGRGRTRLQPVHALGYVFQGVGVGKPDVALGARPEIHTWGDTHVGVLQYVPGQLE